MILRRRIAAVVGVGVLVCGPMGRRESRYLFSLGRNNDDEWPLRTDDPSRATRRARKRRVVGMSCLFLRWSGSMCATKPTTESGMFDDSSNFTEAVLSVGYWVTQARGNVEHGTN